MYDSIVGESSFPKYLTNVSNNNMDDWQWNYTKNMCMNIENLKSQNFNF